MERNRKENRRDGVPARERAPTGSTVMGFDPSPIWTLDDFCCEYQGLMNVKRFDVMTVDGKNIVLYNCKDF